MKQYDSYKDSGVQWIGEIPSHWEMRKLKFLVSCNDDVLPDSTSKDQVIQYVEIGDVSSVEGIKKRTEYEFKDAPSRARRITKSGDVIVSTVRTYLKAISKIDEEGLIVSTGFAVLRPRSLYENYLGYALLSELFIGEVISKSEGVSFPAINSTALINIKVPTPEYEEQIVISSYLDKKCAEIDKAIATQQKRIELLQELRQNIITHAVTRGINPDAPLKDSGVEWIGMVPEHWEIKRIKHCANIFGRIGFRGYTTEDLVSEGEGPITLSPSNMQGKMNYDSCSYLSWYKYNESPEIQIYNGDVLFVKTGSTYGKSAYVENLPMEATINPQIVVFKDFNNCNSKFFYYMLTTHVVQNQVDNTVIGSTIPTIGQEKIRNYVLPIPPLNEQQAIVVCIESETGKLDKQVAKANRQISLLQELKQSIITEVVTGKRKVC